MRERIDEIMELSLFELQKRSVATLIAIIESEDFAYDEEKVAAINALPDAQTKLLETAEYYDEVYDEIYDEVLDDVVNDVADYIYENDCEECDCDCDGDLSQCPCAECLCEDNCEDCECEDCECDPSCDCYYTPCIYEEKNDENEVDVEETSEE